MTITFDNNEEQQAKGKKARRQKGSGGVYLREGSPIWQVSYYKNGKLYRESSKSTKKTDAQTLLKARLGEMANGTFAGPKTERVLIDELAEDYLRYYRINGYKTMKSAIVYWEMHLKSVFGGVRVVDVTSDYISRYVDMRLSEGAANKTINLELGALKTMFNLGYKSTPPKVQRVPHIPMLKVNNVRKGFLEDDQFEKLVEGQPLWFHAIVECGRTYGWRKEELLDLRAERVDIVNRTIRLNPGETKNDDGREVYISDSVLPLLTELVKGKSGLDFIFTRENGSIVRSINARWHAQCVMAGLANFICSHCKEVDNSHPYPRPTPCPHCGFKGFRLYRGLIFHDLRRTAARRMRRVGGAETVIMKIGGWRTNTMFRRYAIVNNDDMADVMRKLDASQKKSD